MVFGVVRLERDRAVWVLGPGHFKPPPAGAKGLDGNSAGFWREDKYERHDSLPAVIYFYCHSNTVNNLLKITRRRFFAEKNFCREVARRKISEKLTTEAVDVYSVLGRLMFIYVCGMLKQGSKSLARIVWIGQSQYSIKYQITHCSIVIGQFKLYEPRISIPEWHVLNLPSCLKMKSNLTVI